MKNEIENNIEEINVEEYSANKTLHECECGLAYYNYQGNHFRVFKTFDDGKEYIETSDDESLVIAEFEDEDDLDEFLLNCKI
jgi:hypothetical protein